MFQQDIMSQNEMINIDHSDKTKPDIQKINEFLLQFKKTNMIEQVMEIK